MKKIVLAPDSFKGTMSALQICRIMSKAIAGSFPHCEVVSVPMADGGEGMVDCFLAAVGGEKVRIGISGPYFERTEGFYGILDGGTAVIEMAAAAGLPMVRGREDPGKTTTYGVGQLIADALKKGCRHILLGLGGSCTNDGGCGACAALGVVFKDKKGSVFVPTGDTLEQIDEIDTKKAEMLLCGADIRIMCDVDNPLCGEEGAAYVFGPQKGADADDVKRLDRGLRHLGDILAPIYGARGDIFALPGGGAAGGMGAGLCAMLGAGLVSGVNGVLDTVDFDGAARDADLIITGEGRLDRQSLRGKVIQGVCRRASALGVPVCAVVGDYDDRVLPMEGLTAVFSINRRAVPFSVARKTSESDLELTVGNMMRLISAAEKWGKGQ